MWSGIEYKWVSGVMRWNAELYARENKNINISNKERVNEVNIRDETARRKWRDV